MYPTTCLPHITHSPKRGDARPSPQSAAYDSPIAAVADKLTHANPRHSLACLRVPEGSVAAYPCNQSRCGASNARTARTVASNGYGSSGFAKEGGARGLSVRWISSHSCALAAM